MGRALFFCKVFHFIRIKSVYLVQKYDLGDDKPDYEAENWDSQKDHNGEDLFVFLEG